MASSSSASMPRWPYDVFLSFRGEDTRNNFVGHLYAALDREGIYTFIDNEELERGKSISPKLMKAIEESRFAIIVFSKKYADSSWCLDELVKILQCQDEIGLTVLPIFYDVDPSQVRKQKRSFAEAFGKHEEIYGEDMEKVRVWRAVLEKAANLSGWDLPKVANGHEMTCIQKIVEYISKELECAPLHVAEHEVGIDSRVNEIIKLLDVDGSKDVRVVGICGMGGIGKTTIAKAVFNRIFNQFESHCFLGNVREDSEKHGLTYLQEELLNEILKGKDLKICNFDRGVNVIKNRLRRKKVLVVLDDVNQDKQLEKLAGERNWFSSGSRIIITTRDEHLLRKADEIYKVGPLNKDEALELFSWHAFTKYHPTKDFVKISGRVIDYAKGLPLALKVLGSLLQKRSLQEWESEVNKLQTIPEGEILNVLRMSYDGLDDTQKKLFLDIACFFKGEEKCYVMDLLESCGFHPVIGISVLIQRSLITIYIDHNNRERVWMHDLIQEMGKEIVRQQSPEDPGKRSRLWSHEDIYKALTQNTVTDNIEGIMLNMPITKRLHVSADAFKKMKNLRLLKISNVYLFGCLTHLSNQLIYLEWDGFPSRSLPENFQPENLVELHLPCSPLKQIWTGIEINLNKLKILDLRESVYLEKTPDFSGFPSLEKLDLYGCTSLVEVHPSIAVHHKLVYWEMRSCKKLRSLPTSIKLKSLQVFNLNYCSQLEMFPEIEGDMGCLRNLNLNGTAIKDLPSSFEYLNGLYSLDLSDCRKLESIPSIIWKLRSLQRLDLRDCLKLEKFSEIEGDVDYLHELLLSGSAIKDIPPSIQRLNGLWNFEIDNCKKLESLPNNICKLKSLRYLTIRGCTKIKKFPEMSREMKGLRELDLGETSIKQLPASIGQLNNLLELNLSGLQLEESSFLGLCSLRVLNLSNCNLLEGSILNSVGCLSSLEVLNLSGNNFASLPASLNQLTKLRRIHLEYCSRLQVLTSLPSSITKFLWNREPI